jgi:hypothetical protein
MDSFYQSFRFLMRFAVLLAIPWSLAQNPTANGAPMLAAKPPMGWNSYDSYGATINEADFKANAEWLASHLKPFGWEYVVIDIEWYASDPAPEGNSKTSHYTVDGYGRFVPAPNRFPSAAGNAGFKPLADYVHSLGLKFGIHMVRGLPKQAVENNLPIAGSKFHAADAADKLDTCPWNPANFGVANTPAGQAYYNSIAELYASWGVDLIKADCISSHPYKGDEIRMLSAALRKTGRPIVLSLSPGPAPLENAAELSQLSQMWRISDDIWDLWHNDQTYPQGLGDQFANATKWAAFSGPGHWPDADMLPLGHLGPAAGWGKPRDTRLTLHEQQTMITLWAIFRSPLMIGAELKSMDPWAESLLTNREVIAVDQDSTDSRQVSATDKIVVWSSKPRSGGDFYLAVFNISPKAERIHYDWCDLGLTSPEYDIRDLWEHKNLALAKSLDLSLASHSCVLFRLSAPGAK